MKRLLVATDGSPHALRAAAFAARLARELREAEVVLVNVGHIPTVALEGPGAGAAVDFAPSTRHWKRPAKRSSRRHGWSSPAWTCP